VVSVHRSAQSLMLVGAGCHPGDLSPEGAWPDSGSAAQARVVNKIELTKIKAGCFMLMPPYGVVETKFKV
jgi:hypothetical protein